MKERPFLTDAYPRAFVHVDGDAFFTSVEQSLEPDLQGRPVVTGKERGIIACASYEARALGVRRGITLSEARQRCPGLVVRPSDYESYALYAKRMFAILRRYSPAVEEYSVDEAFADITGMRRVFQCSYETLAHEIQDRIHAELGITVSVGLSLSKTLTKICSDFRKPAGFTAVPGNYIHLLLQRTPLEQVWGMGPSMVHLLTRMGLRTAHDFAIRPMAWADRLLGKPGRDLWEELRGGSVWQVVPEEKVTHATLTKSKTFTPPSGDKALVYAKLMRNIEAAFAKARRHKLRAARLSIALRHGDFHHDAQEARLDRPTSSPLEALPVIRELFEKTFVPGANYRATLVVLARLEDDASEQPDFFEDRPRIERQRRATQAVDVINLKYGKHTLCSGTALDLALKIASDRDAPPPRRAALLKGENARRRLRMPKLDIRV